MSKQSGTKLNFQNGVKSFLNREQTWGVYKKAKKSAKKILEEKEEKRRKKKKIWKIKVKNENNQI